VSSATTIWMGGPLLVVKLMGAAVASVLEGRPAWVDAGEPPDGGS
jgi:hypothetical protein